MDNLLEINLPKFSAFGCMYPGKHTYYQIYQVPQSLLTHLPEGKSNVIVFTDGACKNNQGLGGWAALLLFNQSTTILELAGYAEQSTNNRMELLSVIQALRSISPLQTIKIFSDSRYVVDGINKWMAGWEKMAWLTSEEEPIKNCDLWLKIATKIQDFEYKVEHISGHNRNWFNERVNGLAQAACHGKSLPLLPKEWIIHDDMPLEDYLILKESV
jgi:ribonuclease HI